MDRILAAVGFASRAQVRGLQERLFPGSHERHLQDGVPSGCGFSFEGQSVGINTNGIPFWGFRCATQFSLFQWGLGCSLWVREFDPWQIL